VKVAKLSIVNIQITVITAMSWLIDLAGKAEHYLEKIDQNTAVVLQNQKEKPSKDVFKY
jgi:hypothetical protein